MSTCFPCPFRRTVTHTVFANATITAIVMPYTGSVGASCSLPACVTQALFTRFTCPWLFLANAPTTTGFVPNNWTVGLFAEVTAPSQLACAYALVALAIFTAA